VIPVRCWIVDYLGIFDDVAKALEFDEESVRRVVSNLEQLKQKLPTAVQKCLAYFKGIDRTVTGYEGLIEAQECLPDDDARDDFAADYSYLSKFWEPYLQTTSSTLTKRTTAG
jgi:type I restriction enzyme R subunit